MNQQKLLQSKIYTLEDIQAKLAVWRFKGQGIVFTNGCFDLLHPGHIKVLTAAKDLGDILIVGLNADVSVKRLKGEQRPIQNEEARALLLSAMSFVDAVILFEEDTPLKLIESIKPNYLVKGGDYVTETVVGYKQVAANGGQVVIVPLLEGHSTTSLDLESKQ